METTTAVATALLEVEHLTTRFPTPRGLVHGVDDVSFALAPGETLGVVGESGSGKSVLARSLMQLVPRHARVSGAVRFEGRELTTLSDAEQRRIWGNEIAMVFQNPMTSLNPVMKVGRQIGESLELHVGVSRDEARARAIELLRIVGIPQPEGRVDLYPHQFSGGMRQRVCIAMAIACHPKLLLADEPTTALDVTIQRQILDLLAELQRTQDMAMILITHDLGVVARRTDRVMVMYGGRIMETGRRVPVLTRPRHPYTAALLRATPRIEHPSHTRLAAIAGLPAPVVDPTPGCRFAARCPKAQPTCLAEDPPLVAVDDDPEHRFACFFPEG